MTTTERIPIRNVLVCYDGSVESDHALDRAAELARGREVSVSLLSVADPIYHTPPYDGSADPAEARAHQELLEGASARLARDGISAVTIVRAGGTADVIEDVARETGADLIVVGSRNHGLLRRLLFGSVSGELLVHGPSDVLVVR
jgi:nucleotide-binding universal stress UspA family protein